MFASVSEAMRQDTRKLCTEQLFLSLSVWRVTQTQDACGATISSSGIRTAFNFPRESQV